MKKTIRKFGLITAIILLLTIFTQPAHAAISTTGDVDPNDPSTWTSSTNGYIGKTGTGTMNITGGGVVSNNWGYIGYFSGSTGEVVVDGSSSRWTNSSSLYVGYFNSGTLNITGGAAVSNDSAFLGFKSGSTGEVTVDGLDSRWTNSSNLHVGFESSGTLNITDGAAVSNDSDASIGHISGSTGEVIVAGSSSRWMNGLNLRIGNQGSGTLNITGGGLVSVAGILTIDVDGDGDGFINMATGGMLALFGDADDSLFDFLGLINGTDAVRYWDDSISDWANITDATYGVDYTLSYLGQGDLAGYTMLTVPEPTTICFLALGGMAFLRNRKFR